MFRFLKWLFSKRRHNIHDVHTQEVAMKRWDTTKQKKEMVQDTLSFELHGQRTLDEWGKKE